MPNLIFRVNENYLCRATCKLDSVPVKATSISLSDIPVRNVKTEDSYALLCLAPDGVCLEEVLLL